jgi:hypothetical protein
LVGAVGVSGGCWGVGVAGRGRSGRWEEEGAVALEILVFLSLKIILPAKSYYNSY